MKNVDINEIGDSIFGAIINHDKNNHHSFGGKAVTETNDFGNGVIEIKLENEQTFIITIVEKK